VKTKTVIDSPVGPLTLVAEDGLLAGVYLQQHRHAPSLDLPLADAPGQVVEQLEAYFTGELRAFDVPLVVGGTGFQREVWAALATIPYGETWSYAKLAAEIGRPRAVRAVGLANGRNPVSIVVPCHRVVGADGSLTGYGGGLAAKQWLLDHEAGSGAWSNASRA
jgi:methylated-DNA-[protein]-cysteine S-methyltransferase